jgi:hypothetical protein
MNFSENWPILNVRDGQYFIQVQIIKSLSPLMLSPTIYMYFSKQWASQLSILKRGDNIKAIGRIKEIESSDISLENCELQDS